MLSIQKLTIKNLLHLQECFMWLFKRIWNQESFGNGIPNWIGRRFWSDDGGGKRNDNVDKKSHRAVARSLQIGLARHLGHICTHLGIVKLWWWSWWWWWWWWSWRWLWPIINTLTIMILKIKNMTTCSAWGWLHFCVSTVEHSLLTFLNRTLRFLSCRQISFF